MVRIGVSAYLSAQPDMTVVGEASNGQEAVELAMKLKPDLILMDNVMPVMTGAEATAEILTQWPEAKIMMVTSFLDDDKVYPALEAGAVSYILKTSNAKQIADAIRKTIKGESVLEPEVTMKMMQRMRSGSSSPLHEQLTEREMEVLLLVAQGKTNQEIADDLFIALKT
ncbi:two-component response regulator, partial [Rhizophagus irregularis]